jgi:hypothetical protein
MEDKDLFWLAGLLEGEGSFLKPPPSKKNRIAVQVEMIDFDIIQRVSQIVGLSIQSPKIRKNYKQTYKVVITGTKAFSLMKELFPLMGLRRQEQISEALKFFSPPTTFEKLPTQEILKEMNKSYSLRELGKMFKCSRQRIFRHIK